jgi:hypothetical protein
MVVSALIPPADAATVMIHESSDGCFGVSMAMPVQYARPVSNEPALLFAGRRLKA